jgi:ubiquinone/menaquinone biosynthesis C-methylase UbiE
LRASRAAGRIGLGPSKEQIKGHEELRYWRDRKREEQTLSNDHYSRFYTTHFGLAQEEYRGKRILDIGCGPRGSLEWAEMAAERVGLDPLAESYEALGTREHAMTYVTAPAERIPFPDGHFDVVCSFNSLDHVDDLDRSIQEIGRVVAPGGLFLLITEVNHPPQFTEPISYSWDVAEKLVPPLELVEVRRYERRARGIYQSIEADVEYDDSNPEHRPGVLSAKFVKPALPIGPIS